MGAFLVNFHAKTSNSSVVREVLAGQAERAWLGPSANGWVSFYEERADTQDAGRIEQLCEQVSLATVGPVIAFLVHDSDFLCYWLFDNGQKRDQYNSCPDYFGDVSELLEPGDSAEEFLARLQGDADALLPLCPVGTDRSAIESLLRVRPGEYVFAEQHLDKLARLLGLDPSRAKSTYRDIGLDVSAEELDLEFAGTGTPPEPGEDSWARSFGGIVGGLTSSADMAGADPVANDGPSLDELLAFAQDPDQKLTLALAAKNLEAADEAIAAGADVNAADGTPLRMAVASGSTESVRLLLERGAEAGCSAALEMATAQGNEWLVRLLLEHGADARHVTEYGGYSVLHYATMSRNPQVVRLLLEAGADPEVKNDQGDTPADFIERLIRQIEEAAALAASQGRPYPYGEEELPRLRAALDVLRNPTGDGGA